MENNKKLVIGLGTGRCGTLSLSTIMNAQFSSCFTHESYIKLPWKPIYEYLKLNISMIMTNSTSSVVGDVAPWYLNYTDMILNWVPTAKFVCLKRNREDVVKSLVYVSDQLKSNHFVSKDSQWFDHNKWTLDTEESRVFRHCFPKYDVPLDMAVGMYWDEYNKRAEMYQDKYPDNFRIFDTNLTLNDQDAQLDMLQWAGFSSTFVLLHLKIFKAFEAHRMGE
jgi:hypothetical protein